MEAKYENFWKTQQINIPIFTIREPDAIYVPMHWHDSCEIILMTSGRVNISILNHEYTLCEGEMIIINSHELHSTNAPILNTCVILFVTDAFWQEHVPGASIPLFPNICETDTWMALKQSLYRMEEAYRRMESSNSLSFFEELFHAMGLLFEMRLIDNKKPGLLSEEQQNRLSVINNYIDGHYTGNITLKEIAGLVGLQPNYFCRFFRDTTGCSFLEYLNDYRIQKIYHDLIFTKDRVETIMYRHGFTNERLFRKLFRERFHSTPLKIRSQNTYYQK